MESWGLAVLVLAAVLVGATIPALVQLRATLRAMQTSLERSGARLDEALGAATATARRIDALAVRLESGGRIEQLVEGVATVGQLVSQLRATLRIASAVGAAVAPAVAAAAHALREDPGAPPPESLHVAETEPEAVQSPAKQAMP